MKFYRKVNLSITARRFSKPLYFYGFSYKNIAIGIVTVGKSLSRKGNE